MRLRRDVVAESLDKKHILIGECKWTTGENVRLLTNEIQKIAGALPFTKGKQVEIVLFTKVTPNEDVGNSVLPRTIEWETEQRLFPDGFE